MSMTVEFMGLCAAISVMPPPYTEFLLDRARQKDHVMEDFLNIFNHRMISFFYRGWEKYRFFIEYEEPEKTGFQSNVGLIGLGTEGLRIEAEFGCRLPELCGAVARHVRTAASLQQILEDYLP